MEGIPSGCAKVYIQRDYTDGMAVKFDDSIPRELENKVSREQFETTIRHINSLYDQAEQLTCSTFCEGCFSCLTSYLFLCCMRTHYEKTAKKVGKYIDEQNESVYKPLGLLLIDPLQRGLRVIEICLLNTNADGTLTL